MENRPPAIVGDSKGSEGDIALWPRMKGAGSLRWYFQWKIIFQSNTPYAVLPWSRLACGFNVFWLITVITGHTMRRGRVISERRSINGVNQPSLTSTWLSRNVTVGEDASETPRTRALIRPVRACVRTRRVRGRCLSIYKGSSFNRRKSVEPSSTRMISSKRSDGERVKTE